MSDEENKSGDTPSYHSDEDKNADNLAATTPAVSAPIGRSVPSADESDKKRKADSILDGSEDERRKRRKIDPQELKEEIALAGIRYQIDLVTQRVANLEEELENLKAKKADITQQIDSYRLLLGELQQGLQARQPVPSNNNQ